LQAFIFEKMNAMTINYLHEIWGVNICLAKIKDGKGKELALCGQEKFANNNLAKMPQRGYFKTCFP
jgi:hypothetical protein